jgi:hypothetical protein
VAALIARLRAHGPEGLWFLLLSLLITWPMAASPTRVVVGHEEATAACHVWVLWWAQMHLGDPQTDLIFHPHGADVVTLYGSDVLSPVLLAASPLPAVLTFNLWVVTLLLLGGFGGRALGRALGATRWGALAGGTVFLAAPFFQHELLNGTTELLAAAALPWFAAVLWRLLETPTRRLGLALGLVTALGTLASAYNAFFLLVVGLCLFLHRVSTTPGPVITREHWLHGLTGVGLSAALLAPLAWLQVGHGAGATLSRRGEWRTQSPPMPDSFADLGDWLDPTPAAIPEVLTLPGGETFSYWTTCSVFLGFVALGLGLAGAWRSRQRRIPGSRGRVVTPLVLLVLVGMLFASGPVARLGDRVLSLGGVPLVMPLSIVAELFPPADLTGLHAYRYAAVVVTGLSGLVALGARGRFWFVLLAAEALLLAPTPWPAAVTPHPESAVLTSLSEDPAPGAVLTLPTRKEDLHDLGRLLLAQTVHGRPVQDGGIHRRAGGQATALFDEVLLLERQAEFTPRFLGDAQARFDLGLMHEAGFRWVLVPAEEEEAMAWTAALLGPPARADAHWALWPMPAPDGARGTLPP